MKNVVIENRFGDTSSESSSKVTAYKSLKKNWLKMLTLNEQTDVGRSRNLAGVGVDFFQAGVVVAKNLSTPQAWCIGSRYCPSLGRRHWDKMIRLVGGSGTTKI